jgi:RimJ/RimL family protein N-acetyltransferase
VTKPLLTTERFALWRPRGIADLHGLVDLIAHEETRRYLGTLVPGAQPQWERLMRNVGSWTLYGYGTFYVRPHGSDEIVGNLGVFHSWRGVDASMDDQPEAGWIVRRDWCGQGLAGEVMRAVMPWFDAEHGPRRVVAMIERGNAGSERMAAKLGFRAYAEIPDPDGKFVDLYERLPD